MVLCASAWMLSAGYITLHKRHIGITVIYVLVDKAKQWKLDTFAYIIGIISLWLFVDDTLVRAIESVMMVERGGTAWNSPQPLILKNHACYWCIYLSSTTSCKYIQTFRF